MVPDYWGDEDATAAVFAEESVYDEVVGKATDLMGPVLGDDIAAKVADAALDVDAEGGLERLTTLLERR